MKQTLPHWLQGLPPESRRVIPRLYEEIVGHRLVREHIDRQLVQLSGQLARAPACEHHALVRSNLTRARALLAALDHMAVKDVPQVLAGLSFITDDAASDPDFEDAERATHDAHVLSALEVAVLRESA